MGQEDGKPVLKILLLNLQRVRMIFFAEYLFFQKSFVIVLGRDNLPWLSEALKNTFAECIFFVFSIQNTATNVPGWNPDPQVSLKDCRIFFVVVNWLIEVNQTRALVTISLKPLKAVHFHSSHWHTHLNPGHNIITLHQKFQFHMFTHYVFSPMTLIMGLESLSET